MWSYLAIRERLSRAENSSAAVWREHGRSRMLGYQHHFLCKTDLTIGQRKKRIEQAMNISTFGSM